MASKKQESVVPPTAGEAQVIETPEGLKSNVVKLVETPKGPVMEFPQEMKDRLQKGELPLPLLQMFQRVANGEQISPEELHATLHAAGITIERVALPRKTVAIEPMSPMNPPVMVGGEPQAAPAPELPAVPEGLVRLTDEQKYILDAFYSDSVVPVLDLVGQRLWQRHQERLGDLGLELMITVCERGFRTAIILPADGPDDEANVLSKIKGDWDQLGEACAEAVIRAEDRWEQIASKAE